MTPRDKAAHLSSPHGPVPAAPPTAAPLGVYLHVPFCQRKCPYCDFNTYAGLESLQDEYVAALEAEIRRWGPAAAGRTVGTVFIGGGTPTVLAPGRLTRILDALRASFDVAAGAEVTCEANPGTVDRARFAELVDAGVNRLSMGAQSFDAGELRFLGRIHDADDVTRAVEAARGAGLANLSLDLMFALPGQTPSVLETSVRRALALETDHLSLYSLTVEAGTPLARWVAEGRVAAPDDDAAAESFALVREILADAGFVHYEVSNWARATAAPSDAPGAAESPALASRHNLGYWRHGEYLGLGAGAHSHLREGGVGRRWASVGGVAGYVAGAVAGGAPVAMQEDVGGAAARGETMMLGLRLVREGVPHARFASLHGVDPREVYASELSELASWGLVAVDDERTVVTRRGLEVANRVMERFVDG